MRKVVPRLATVIAAFAAVAPAGATSRYLGIDVPSQLGGVLYSPQQILRCDDGAYGVALTLPAGVPPLALHRLPDGRWMFSPAVPVTLAGTNYEPRDLVTFDGSSYTPYLRGADEGIPPNARIDALFLSAENEAIVSFDVPVSVQGTGFGRSDLVRRDQYGTYYLYWNAATAGVPATSNVVGADLGGDGGLVVSFDVPTRSASGTVFLPGELVRWYGGALFGRLALDAGWPPATQGTDFSLIDVSPGSGRVPDGHSAPGQELLVTRNGTSAIEITWGPSCLPSDTDFVLYEGLIGAYASHAPRLCTTGGARSAIFTPVTGGRYFLVAPRNASTEGSLGVDDNGVERPAAASPCLPRAIRSCP